MNTKKITYIILIVLIAIGIGSYIILTKKSAKNIPAETQITQTETEVVYKNTEYGFDFSLPDSWKGYSVIEDKWEGQILDAQGTLESATKLEGPKITIRHPLWTQEAPRQDIPIMIFTLPQWDLIQQEKLSVSAAPIGPMELGSNANYVFALPARYNFAFLTGFEEVQKIIEDKSLSTF